MAPERITLKETIPVLTGMVLCEALGAWMIDDPTGVAALRVIGAVRLVEIAGICLYFRLRAGGLARIGLAAHQMMPGIFRGAIWSLGFGGAVLAAGAVLLLAGVDPVTLIRGGLPADPLHRAALFLVGGIVSPVAEELFFRGVLYGFLRRFGILFAMTASTLAFVLLHPAGGWIQAAGGLLFVICYEMEGTLAAPITIHVLGNLALFTVALLPAS